MTRRRAVIGVVLLNVAVLVQHHEITARGVFVMTILSATLFWFWTNYRP